MAKTPESRVPEAEQTRTSETGDLAARIVRAKQGGVARQAAQAMRQNEMTGMGRGLRFASEFMAAVVIGAILGFALDVMLGTSPWGLIVLMLVGFAAGVLNVIRAAAEQNAAVDASGDAGSLPDDNEEDD